MAVRLTDGAKDDDPGHFGLGTVIERCFREEWGRIVAALIHMTGDWDLAEDCAQEAFAQASGHWGAGQLPEKPGAWLMTVARNRALDRLRRRSRQAAKLGQLASMGPGVQPGADEGTVGEAPADLGVPDERLRLVFTCCHPALAMEARVALTLRTLAGLTTTEIARAFLVPEATMAKRLVRAKQKIAHARIPYRVPPQSELGQRTSGVLAVLYLLFNEGYSASAGAELVRRELCNEAVALARVTTGLMPGNPECAGLLALMLYQRSRLAARRDARGDLVTLEDQDRSRWDEADITEAVGLTDKLASGPEAGPYQVQALIASCHATAGRAQDTDWAKIAHLYGVLLELVPSPVVALNRAVAVGMADGPDVGLALAQELSASEALAGYFLLAATKADFLRRLGRHREAAASYRQALALVGTEPERRFLSGRLAEAESRAAPA